jgi:hypothetical protein
MKKIVLCCVLLFCTTKIVQAEDIGRVDMHRLYNRSTHEHFYTGSVNEKNHLVSVGWRYEGIAFVAPKKSNQPVYRLYHGRLQDHHYTMSTHERDVLVAKHGWRYEGVGWYSSEMKSVPLFRLYHQRLTSGSHHYTISRHERDVLVSQHGWQSEGVSWYGLSTDKTEVRLDGPTGPADKKYIPSRQWLNSYRNAMLGLVNQERTRMGRSRLILYSGNAQAWSEQMAQVNTLYHGSTDGTLGSIWQNVAYSYVDRDPKEAARVAFKQYLEEKPLWQSGNRDHDQVGHYLNIIEPEIRYADFGVTFSNEVAFSTQNFK